MAISFVGKGSFGSGTASVSAGAVSGVQADDLLLLFVESANQPFASLTGWTQVTNSPVTAGTAAAAGGMALQVFYQWATGADTTTTVGDSGDHTTCIKLAYRGVDRTTPFDATPVTGTKTTASTSSSYPGITTVTANAEVIFASALDLDAASTATTTGWTNANISGLTEQHDQTVTSGAGGGIVIADGTKVTAGATGNTTATVTSTAQVYLTLALRPAPDNQTLTQGSTFTNTATIYSPTVTPGTVALTAALLTNTQTFYAPTVANAALTQDLTPARYDNAQAFYAPAITTAVTLTASRFDGAQTFYAPTVAPGAITLSPARVDNAQVFYAPTAAPGPVSLAAARLDNAQTFYGPTVAAGAVTLAAPLTTNAQAFYAPAVAPGAVNLSPSPVENTQTFYAATITTASTDAILVPLVHNTNTFGAATVTPGTVTLAPARVDGAQEFYGAIVAQGAGTQSLVQGSRADNSQAFYGPAVDQGGAPQELAQTARADNAQVFYVPTATPGPITLAADRLDNAQVFYGAAASQDAQVRFPEHVAPGWVEPGWTGWPYFNASQFFGASVFHAMLEVDPASRWVVAPMSQDHEAEQAGRVWLEPGHNRDLATDAMGRRWIERKKVRFDHV